VGIKPPWVVTKKREGPRLRIRKKRQEWFVQALQAEQTKKGGEKAVKEGGHTPKSPKKKQKRIEGGLGQ